jgi:hypothetical protein
MHPLALPLRVPALTALARVALLTLPFLPFAVPPTRGGTTPQEAAAAFKADATAAVKTLKSQLQLAKKAFLVDLDHYEDAVDSGGNILDETTSFAVDVDDFQHAVQFAANTAFHAVVDAGAAALDGLAGGSPLDGVFPKDLSTGAGGAFDKARKDIRSQVDQLYKSLAGRLKKTVTVLKKNGAGLTIEVKPPACVTDGYFSDLSNFTNNLLFSMDVLIAVNRTDLAEDGTVWLGGTNTNPSIDIDASVTGDEQDSTLVTPSNVTGRWNATLTDGGTRFKKGNYAVLARPEGLALFVSSSFGIR